VTTRSAKVTALFVGLAVVFGLGVWYVSGPRYAGEFFAGWLTEYSLSIDNLFIFIIIMTKLKVPRELQQFALLVGIVLALVFRGIFIAVGAAAIDRFSWVFFLFGLFLLYTAVRLVIDYRNHDDDEDAPDNPLIRFVRRRFPSTDDFDGPHLQKIYLDLRFSALRYRPHDYGGCESQICNTLAASLCCVVVSCRRAKRHMTMNCEPSLPC
jgi:tellurite resistance protein TerC